MRFNLSSADRPKAIARKLARILAETGPKPSHSKSLELAAALYGYSSWHELTSSLGTQENSPEDYELSREAYVDRKTHHVNALLDHGLEFEASVHVVKLLNPTNVRRTRSEAELAHWIVNVLFENGASDFLAHPNEDGTMSTRLRRLGSDGLLKAGPDIDASTLVDLRRAFGPVAGGSPQFKATGVNDVPIDGRSDTARLRVQWSEPTFLARLILHQPAMDALRAISATFPIEPRPEKPAIVPVPYGRVLEAFETTKRGAWFPRPSRRKPDPKGSRYYGEPWLPDGVLWPEDTDGNPMEFVFQVAASDLTHEARALLGGASMLSFFYAVDADYEDFKNDPNARIMRLDTSLPGSVRTRPDSDHEDRRPTSFTVAWTRLDDFSDPTGIPRDVHGAVDGVTSAWIHKLCAAAPGGNTSLYYADRKKRRDYEDVIKSAARNYGPGVVDVEMAKKAVSLVTTYGDKLGGWPNWAQGPEWAQRGKRTMTHLYQIDEGDPIHKGRAIFSNGGGIGHVFVDPNDPDFMTFCWACD